MKVRKTEIPETSLVRNYYPADYKDAFVYEVGNISVLSPDNLLFSFWTDFPAWVNLLFKIRNFLVKFVGLEGSMNSLQELEACIKNGNKCSIASVPAKNEAETVLLLDDKHLSAYLSVYIESCQNVKSVYAITLVHFKNRLGRVYFFFIRPFHGLIVKGMLKRACNTGYFAPPTRCN